MRSNNIALTAWQKVLTNIKRRKQTKTLEADLIKALEQVTKMKKSGARKESLKDFLRALYLKITSRISAAYSLKALSFVS